MFESQLVPRQHTKRQKPHQGEHPACAERTLRALNEFLLVGGARRSGALPTGDGADSRPAASSDSRGWALGTLAWYGSPARTTVNRSKLVNIIIVNSVHGLGALSTAVVSSPLSASVPSHLVTMANTPLH